MADVEKIVIPCIQDLLSEKSSAKKLVHYQMLLVDELGLSSMDIARLIARLDIELHKEPFDEDLAITDIRTIEDLIAAYQ